MTSNGRQLLEDTTALGHSRISKSSFTLSALVPLYNEIELVDVQIRRINDFLKEHVAGHEIIIIESGSTDGSGPACDRLAAELSEVRVIHEGARNGYGSALRLGFAAATKDLVISIPVDLPFPLPALAEALSLIGETDCVLSFRVDDPRHQFRRVQSSVYNALIKRVLGLPMRTVNSAMKLYRRSIIEAMDLRSDGWLIDAEILYWISRCGFRYREIPITVPEREAGVSKVRLTDPLRILYELRKLKRALGAGDTRTR